MPLFSALIAAAVAGSAAFHPSSHCAAHSKKVAETLESTCYATEYGGRERTVRIYAPAPRSTPTDASVTSVTRRGPIPVVLALHGLGSDSGLMEWLTKGGFNRLADRSGALIVYVDGVGRSWNDGLPRTDTQSVKENVDDVRWLRSLPRLLTAMFDIDVKRVYVVGMSSGGMMSLRLACEAADVFTASAAVAAELPVHIAQTCSPARPIPVLLINGTADPIMRWAWGPPTILMRFMGGGLLSTNQTVARLTEVERCEGLHTDGRWIDSAPPVDTSMLQYVATCPQEGEIVLYEIRGGGHTWPRGQYRSAGTTAQVSKQMEANETIWRFFFSHRLR